MSVKAVFFDRDDTLNYDPGYLGDPSKVELYNGVPEGISILKNDLNFKIIVISNQSGIARNLITEPEVNSVNNRINELLSNYSTKIDAFYFCPHHPEFSEKPCNCRKPSPEMVFKAASDYNIDLKSSYFVGDKISDVECGNNAGVKTVLVTTTIKESERLLLQNQGKTPNFVADNFLDACNIIAKDSTGGNV
ncbi:MAG: HAD family hydrolase [Melioribacteraceae bacterium]|nr:HAD family hydrolase [Melioribacteraceae bacterium]